MKGIRWCLVGICTSLVGIAVGSGNASATFLAGVGLCVTLIGVCIKD